MPYSPPFGTDPPLSPPPPLYWQWKGRGGGRGGKTMDFFTELVLAMLFSILLAFLLGTITGGGNRAEPTVHAAGVEQRRTTEEERKDELVRSEDGADRREEVALGGSCTVDGGTTEIEVILEERLEAAWELELESGPEEVRSVETEIVGAENAEGEVNKGEEEVLWKSGAEEEEKEEEKWGTLLCGEDEWEGIERSELEDLFGVAAKYAESKRGREELAKMSSEPQLQLYGLHKVATEGRCYESQPMPLMLSARAKWNAWQRLGGMNPEIAMEQYVTLLSECIPGWNEGQPGEEAHASKGNDSPGTRASGIKASVPRPTLHQCPDLAAQRLLEDSSCVSVEVAATDQKPSNQGLTKIFLLNLLSPPRVTFLTFCR